MPNWASSHKDLPHKTNCLSGPVLRTGHFFYPGRNLSRGFCVRKLKIITSSTNQKIMKKLFLILFSLITAASYAQTAEEVVKQYADAMGGLDAFKKVQTARITGNVSIQGGEFPLTIQIINGRAFRTDVDVMGQAVTNSYKDGKGWKLNPFGGFETATDVEGAELTDFKAQANLATGLMDYQALGHTIELVGQEDVEGVKTYKIKLSMKEDGRSSFFYIGTTDHLIVKVVTTREIQGADTEIETYFSNVKEFGGLKFFMTRDQKMSGQIFQSIIYTNVELNVPVDEKIFDK